MTRLTCPVSKAVNMIIKSPPSNIRSPAIIMILKRKRLVKMAVVSFTHYCMSMNTNAWKRSKRNISYANSCLLAMQVYLRAIFANRLKAVTTIPQMNWFSYSLLSSGRPK